MTSEQAKEWQEGDSRLCTANGQRCDLRECCDANHKLITDNHCLIEENEMYHKAVHESEDEEEDSYIDNVEGLTSLQGMGQNVHGTTVPPRHVYTVTATPAATFDPTLEEKETAHKGMLSENDPFPPLICKCITSRDGRRITVPNCPLHSIR